MRNRIYLLCLAIALSGSAAAADGEGIKADVLVKAHTSWDGNQLPAYPATAPEISILRIKIAPGAQLPMHKHLVINAGLMLSGELTVVTDEGKTLHLKQGDPIVEVVNTWHYGKNEGETPAEIVVFYAGSADSPITVKK